jgi:Uma2 family endonuclease
METLQLPMRANTYAYLEEISWDEYESLLEEIGERPIRCTYDSGRLEIMTLSHEHEFERTLIGRFVGLLAAILNIPMKSGGSNTMKRELLEKGLEPDECYWIRHERQMRKKKRLNLDVDPPPDLVAEIDVSRSAINRMSIYAALRVPEVWRWRQGKLIVHLIARDGKYRKADRSQAFPFLPLDELQLLLDKIGTLDETSLVREFMAWIEHEIKPRLSGGRKNGKRGAAK